MARSPRDRTFRRESRPGAPSAPGTGRRAVLAAVLLTACLADATPGQVVRMLEPGARVRVRLEEAQSNVVAILVAARPDTIVLERPSSPIESRIPLPVASIRKLEVSAGRRQLAPIGVIIGSVVGAGAVAAYNAILQSQCFGNCPRPTSPFIGAGAGAVIGGLTFYFRPAERWVEVALPRPRRPPGGR